MPGRDDELDAWLHGIIEVAARFAGHEGVTVLRPRQRGGEYVLIVRFATADALRAWEASDERARWLEKGAAISKAPVVHRQTGLETWFSLEGEPPPTPPARWRMATVTWVAIYPLVVLLTALLGPALEPLPLWLRPLPMTLLLVPLMTWVVMPQLTRLFWKFLYPHRKRPRDAP